MIKNIEFLGYVLSKGAVKALIEKGYSNTKCRRGLEGGPEDVNIGKVYDE